MSGRAQPRVAKFLPAVLFLAVAAPSALADVVSLTLNPTSVIGTDPSTATVCLNAGLPVFRTVTLLSSNPAVASVPTSRSLLPGQNCVDFTVTTSAIAVSTNVTITATHNGVSRQAVITVRPPSLTGVIFSPNPVIGGQSSIATIIINRPAPANWLCSISGPFPPIYFTTGSIVSFTPGATFTTKTVNTQAVTSPVDALITVRPPTGQSPIVSGTLQVVPIRAASITLSPQGVTAGGPSLACVTLNAPAPAGGATVQLLSSSPVVASVQPTLQIAAGDIDGCVIVQSHAVADCATATISATYGGQTVQADLAVGINDRLTDDDVNEVWSSRNSNISQGMLLWNDHDNVFFYNGNAASEIQPLGALQAVESTVFGLGSGAAAGQVIGAWRRGTDYAWVWQNNGSQPVPVTATNPFNPNDPMNPEALAIGDGAVFMTLQAFVNAQSVKHVYRVNPQTGVATSLTGTAAAPGASRISTSGGQAAWVFLDPSLQYLLQFYNGSTVATVDSGSIGANVRISHGRIVYYKLVSNIWHVFLYDSTRPNPAPVQISGNTPAGYANTLPVTDGRHIAWLYSQTDGSHARVMLPGGLTLGEERAGSSIFEDTLQMDRGQLAWTHDALNLRYFHDGQVESVCISPARVVVNHWLADGDIDWMSSIIGETGLNDQEVFLHAGVTPDDADQPLPPLTLTATAGDRAATLNWDSILGATSYNVYLAEQPGVTKDNFASLPGGRRVSGITAIPATIGGLVNGRTYYFVVTAVEGADEGGNSMEASARPDIAWTPVAGVAGTAFYAVAGSDTNSQIAYAASSTQVYKTVDGGDTWSLLTGAIANRSTRALAVHGDAVFAVTLQGDVLRSTNAGTNWAVVADGTGFGESNASIAIDPSNPQIVYAGDLRLTPDAPTLVVKSTDGGDTWSQLPATPAGELHAYSLAVDSSGIVYLAGTGVPVARSADHGATWTDLNPGVFLFYSVAVDPLAPATVYAGSRDNGLYKSTNSGGNWNAINNGLPLQQFEAVNSILIDPQDTQTVRVGTARGVFLSGNAGGIWSDNSGGMLPNSYVFALARLSSGNLIAATNNGLYTLDLASCPADLNGDGAVGLSDLTILLGHFGVSSGATASQGDLNGDGAIGLSDLTIFLGQFGSICP